MLALCGFGDRINGLSARAFLVRGENGGAYVLTCAHVVNLAIGERKTSIQHPGRRTIEVESAENGGWQKAAMLEHWIAPAKVNERLLSPLADIAVLSVNVSANPGWPALLVLPPRDVVPGGMEVPFHSFGFMGPLDGTRIDGKLRAVNFGLWFAAKASEAHGWFFDEGLSGAPVFDANDAILGMVVQRLGESSLGEDSKEGMVVPSMVLAQAWPVLTNPYIGLHNFQAETAHLFFGRGRPLEKGASYTGTIRRLRTRLDAQRILGVIGASGSGKSSLVLAGLAPWLLSEGWAVIAFRPGEEPLHRFAGALAAVVEPEAQSNADRRKATEAWEAQLEAGRLDDALASMRTQHKRGVLFVIDQFEEFFTADREKQEAVAQERTLILGVLRDAVGADDVRVVLTLRMDLQARALADPQARDLLSGDTDVFTLPMMSPSELREAIVGAACLFNVSVDPGLATDLGADAARGEGRLPLLQVALQERWQQLERREEGWRLTYPNTMDGEDKPPVDLEAVLTRRANAALTDLQRRFPGPPVPLDAIRHALLGLVRIASANAVATKRVVTGALPEEEPDPVWPVLERLAEQRLVTLGSIDRRPTAELAHESLITSWKTLAEWIEADRDFLRWRERLREFLLPAWHDNQEGLKGRELAAAADWLERRREAMTAAEVMFIEISMRHAETVAAAEQAAVAARLALETQLRKAAEEERDRALLQEARAVTTSSAGVCPPQQWYDCNAGCSGRYLPDPERGIRRPVSNVAMMALLDGYLRNREKKTLIGHSDSVVSAVFSPDGRHVLTASADATARVWDLEGDLANPRVLQGHSGWVQSAVFSPNGRQVLTASEDATARVWDLEGDLANPRVLQGHSGIWCLRSSARTGGMC